MALIILHGPRLSALVGLLGRAFPLTFSKTQVLLDQLLGVEISRGAIAAIRQRLSAALEQPMHQAIAFAPGVIQSVSQAPWPGLSASVEAGGTASSQCPIPLLPQPISI